MEIDLELPSNEQKKLDTISDTTGDIMDGEDRVDVDNGDGNSPRIGEYVEECGPSASERVAGSGNQVDLSVVGANVHKGVMCEPQNGLEFESKEAAYSFYREYARSVGFGITIKASRRSKKSGKFIDVKIACSRFGSKRESSTTTNARSSFPKTGCNAGMHMKRRPDEKLGEEGSLSQEAYDIALQALGEALKHCVDMNNSVRGVLEANTSSARGFLGNEKENRGNSMAKASKRKKMHKKKKVRPEPERISIGLQDSCQQMDQMNSRAHTVNNCYLPRRDMQQMDSGSRAPTLDGHYHSQNNMQVVGQVNSISPICDASYYGNQQCMQGQGQLHSISARVSHYGTQQSMHGLLQGQLGFRASAMHGCFDIQDSLQDMDENSAASTQFHGISSKRLQDKNISR
ncbi:hypothetical protein CUMW_002730 [Citrus unshiu]|nr:hypothetical protein CUMW_002730 [Citrus unshiu]